MRKFFSLSARVFLMSFALIMPLSLSAEEQKEAGAAPAESSATERPYPKQLQFTKWTPDFEVPDPVAISFDPEGRAYVTQTVRRKANDLDIRESADWIPDDLSFQSIEDKIRFYHEQFTPEKSVANAHRVKDHNGDGIHDIRDLTALSERVHLVSDENGNGFADSIHVFAEEMDHLIGGVAGGVLFHEGDVYVSPVPELLRFRDTTGDDRADEREVVATGFGVHLAYAGHDMHGLFVGPDGRIYWSIGDKGIRVKTNDGFDYRFPNQGGLMRCEPDGSNFEVFAFGQRNIQEIAFDEHGNFFGVDNDADFPGERERLVFIEQYVDIGWRANWQYRRSDYNPWMAEDMHVPYEDGQPRWFTPALANYENGPAGFKYNPGTGLGLEYLDYFFMTSAPRGQQWAFQVKPRGDSFVMVNDHQIGEGIALVGLNFSPDGALFGVDWGGGYPLNESGGVWRIDVAPELRHPARSETQELIAADFGQTNSDFLQARLGHLDQRVRLKAQFELARREALDALETVASDPFDDRLARIHAIWGIGQLQRRGLAEETILAALFDDPDEEVRAQAIKTVTDPYGRRLGLDRVSGPAGEDHRLTPALLAKLEDESLRVRMQALLGLGRVGDPSAVMAILACLDDPAHNVGMTYLRHAGVVALAGSASLADLGALADHGSDFVRTCAVVALRRRGAIEVAKFLKDADPVIAGDAARAIHDDWMIPEALPELAAALGTHLNEEPFTRRALNANFRLGDAESAGHVAAFVAEGKADETLLEIAVRSLLEWSEPDALDLVEGRHRPLEPRDPQILHTALEDHLDAMLRSSVSLVRTGAMELARSNELPVNNETLVAVVQNRNASPLLRSEALRTLAPQNAPQNASQNAPQLATIVRETLHDESEAVSKTALELLANFDAAQALVEIRKRLSGAASVPVKQHAIRSIPLARGDDILVDLIGGLVNGELELALQLDVYETAVNEAFLDNPAIREPITALEAAWQAAMATDMMAPFLLTLEGGDAERGKFLFVNHAVAQCIQCHKVSDGRGSDVGPNLKGIGEKFDLHYLLESLIEPQKIIAEGYGNIALTLADGSSVAGQFRGEKKGEVVIRDPENRELRIPVEKIAERSPVISTMPPMGFLMQKGELRDMVAYLKSL